MSKRDSVLGQIVDEMSDCNRDTVLYWEGEKSPEDTLMDLAIMVSGFSAGLLAVLGWYRDLGESIVDQLVGRDAATRSKSLVLSKLQHLEKACKSWKRMSWDRRMKAIKRIRKSNPIYS